MSLDSIVNVSISAQTTSPSRKGFGIPLITQYHTHNTDRIRFYESLLAMTQDGFATTEAAYLAAKAVFAQNPRPLKVAIGRLTVASTMTIEFTPVVANLTAYKITVNGVTYTYTSDGSATAAEIVDGLVALILVAGVTPSNVANKLHIVASTPGTLFTCYADDNALLTRQDITADTSGIAAQLAAISVIDDTWYCLLMTDMGIAQIEAAAAYIETVSKIAVFTTGDSDVLTASNTDVASVLKGFSYARSATVFHRKPHEYASAAWAGNQLPRDPGSSTWKFKTLPGISEDTFNATEITKLTAKHCNYYSEIAGIDITQEGVTSSGEFIDVTILVDWLKAQIQEGIFAVLAKLPKVPFTDHGIALIEGVIRSVLRAGVTVGGLVDDDVLDVIVPKAADVSSANKAARTLTGVTFQATLAGAVHSLTINGTVTA